MSIKRFYPEILPSIELDFANTKRLDPRITFSRASSATRINQNGEIEVVPAGTPRFEHDFVTRQSLGFAVEIGNTNFITHSVINISSLGPVASGALPSGWALDQLQSGISCTTVGSGIEKGLTYVDIRYSGTSTNGNRTLIRPGNAFAVASGDSFRASIYAKLVSGSIPANTTAQFEAFGSPIINLSSIDNTLRRYSSDQATPYQSAATAFPRIDVGPGASGITVDFTIRIAAPQLTYSNTSQLFSFIPTSGATATMASEIATINLAQFGAGYNPSGSTFLMEATSRSHGSARYLSFDNITFGTVFGLSQGVAVTGPAQTNNAFTPTVFPVSLGSSFKAAARIVPGESSPLCVNGSAPVINSGGTASGTTFLDVTQLIIGGATGNSGGALIGRLAYWPSGVSLTQLQGLTV